MTISRGLKRIWIVLALFWVIGASIASGVGWYEMNREEAELVAVIEANPAAADKPYRYGNTANSELARTREYIRQMRYLLPLAIVGPPIGLLIAGVALWW